jgi:SpoVK/Ycf46/Vps4 family AAA+-type ATPase
MTEYIIDKVLNNNLTQTNSVYVKSKSLDYIKINTGDKTGIFKVIQDDSLELNKIHLNSYQRTFLNCVLGLKVQTIPISNGLIKTIQTITFVAKNISPKTHPLIEISDDFIQEIKTSLLDIPIQNELQLSYKNMLNLIPINLDTNTHCEQSILTIGPNTEIKIISTDRTIQIDTSNTKELFKGDFNFMEMGIGGLDKQFEVVFRRAFSSRLIPEKILKNLGVNHVRGMILYGPAGCGKTLIARQIGKILNCEEPKVVNGPSLLSSYIGQSEANVRNLFANAIEDKQGKKLHLIILDEFDSLGRKRGTSGADSGPADKVVNQFLSMIDGPESLNNILLIAMTNRLDMIDEALLRPGRFEVHIEIGLPDEKGRLDILKIHTNKMNQTGYLKDVNLEQIATMTKNFTGAEIESVVKNAVSYSIAKELDPSNLNSIKDINPIVTQHELMKSVQEIKPQFGTVSNEIEIITSIPFELYSDEYSRRYNDILEKINNLTTGNLLSILIQGDPYVGKTTMACQIAKNCKSNCIKFINSETLMNYNYKENQLYDIFEQGCRSESFILILDSVEKLIEYSKLGHVYNNKILQSIYVILSKIIEPTKKVIVILTSSNKMLMGNANLDISSICTYTYQLSDTSTPNTQNEMVSKYFREKKFKINN